MLNLETVIVYIYMVAFAFFPRVDAPKPEIYRLPAKESEELKSADDVSNCNLVKDETFSELAPVRSSTEVCIILLQIKASVVHINFI